MLGPPGAYLRRGVQVLRVRGRRQLSQLGTVLQLTFGLQVGGVLRGVSRISRSTVLLARLATLARCRCTRTCRPVFGIPLTSGVVRAVTRVPFLSECGLDLLASRRKKQLVSGRVRRPTCV